MGGFTAGNGAHPGSGEYPWGPSFASKESIRPVWTQLIEGAREIRSPLAAGYLVMLAGWLWLGDRLPDRDELPVAARLAVDAFLASGAAGQAAILTFVALSAGLFLERLVVADVRDALQRRLGPDWQTYVGEARDAARTYEEYSVTAPNSGSPVASSHKVPSRTWSEYLRSEVDTRTREHSETQFRITLALFMTLPLSAVILREPGWYSVLGLAAVAVVVWDLALLGDKVRHAMHERRLEVAKEQRSVLKENLVQAETQLENSAQAPVNQGEVKKLQEKVESRQRLWNDSREELERLEADRPPDRTLRGLIDRRRRGSAPDA